MRHRVACLLLVLQATVLASEPPELTPHPASLPWPTISWPRAALAGDVDTAALERELADLFEQHIGPSGHPDHRALLVVHRGAIVLEEYAPGFDPTNRFMSWSLAKSITNAFVGRLVMERKLELDAPAAVPAWQGQPERQDITLRHLLNMTAGLGDDRTVSHIIFAPGVSRNMFAAAAGIAQQDPPGTRWAYSTASSNLAAAIASREVGRSRDDVAAWLNEHLFHVIGARSFELEFDLEGHFVGGVFAWATARDWARLGYLYLRDGVWDGQRLLPEGWVNFSRTPADVPDNHQFGANLWISAPASATQSLKLDAGLKAFYMSGSQGQMVVMVPDRDLIVVRLGEAHHLDWDAINAFASRIAAAFPRVAE